MLGAGLMVIVPVVIDAEGCCCCDRCWATACAIMFGKSLIRFEMNVCCCAIMFITSFMISPMAVLSVAIAMGGGWFWCGGLAHAFVAGGLEAVVDEVCRECCC